MAFRYSLCVILSTCIVYLFLVPPVMDLPFLPYRSTQQLHFRSLSVCCVLSSVLYMCYLTVTPWEIPLSSFYSWGNWGLEIELKYFIQGLPAQRSNPPEMRHAGLREESMRYIQIFPYSEAFDSEIHTHLGVGKKGLVSCLSSSQRDFNVLWFELSLALGKKQSQAFESWRTVPRGVLRASLLASRNAILLVTRWDQIDMFLAFQESFLFPRLRDLRRSAHWFTGSWIAPLGACMSAWVV